MTVALNTIDQWEHQNHPLSIIQAKIIARADNQTNINKIVTFDKLLDMLISERKESDDRIYEVDQFYVISNGNLLSTDKLHPTTQAYRHMAKRWGVRLIVTGVLERCN